ncbi:ribonuclease Z [Persicitalea jodogahamensis]|uniref:Ribonuclease Z n=1 Tax=Persicitalea jodogahamensis TaxID=402147 RepID=A0A8J3DAH6_9BACT|nr:ribonuclease Z [Persicitalea jodogahamensis]GHB76048.1 ribonuclease Z [Persicitalea jodogahamensis]
MTFAVTILGAGSATPTLTSHASAQVVHMGSDYYLIDCGEGTQYRLLEQKIRPGRLKGIFITHLHGDHYFGLFGLLTSLSLGSRTEDLLLFGPKGLSEILTEIFRQSDTRLSYYLNFQEIDAENPGLIFDSSLFSVSTLPLRHRIPCTGFLFREKIGERNLIKRKILPEMSHEALRMLKGGQDVMDGGGKLLYACEEFTTPPAPPRSYAYCSDTIFRPELVPYLEKVDCLYHEATFRKEELPRATKTHHSTAGQAATLAKEAGVGKLLIGHLSSRYTEAGPSLEEARNIFPETYFAEEGQTYTI